MLVEISNNPDTVENLKKKRGIKAVKAEWKRQNMHLRRMKGEEYIGFHKNGKHIEQNVPRPSRKLGSPCTSKFCEKAKNRFCNKFDINQRLDIFNRFWAASWSEKKTYACNTVFMVPIKRKTNQLAADSRRTYTFQYNLKYNESDVVPVCKNMYLGTLGLKENMLQNWVKNSTNGFPKICSKINEANTTNIESQPVHRSSLNTRNIFIDDWFNSLAKMPSHYCRKNTERLYIEGPFKDIQDIYNVYKKKSNDSGLVCFSKTFFRNYMKERKLSIYSPHKDQCDLCCFYQVGNVGENDYALHIASKNRAREEK